MTTPPYDATVLIVDDESLFRRSVADAIDAAHPRYRVRQAGDGVEALALIDGGVDVVVTDIHMPVMDGLEMLLELHRRKFRGRLIVVTAFGNPALEDQIADLGVFRYFEKPVEVPDLVDAICEGIEGERSHVEGLTLAGFVQLLALERKTCRLRVERGGQIGQLILREGALVDAKTGTSKGLDAALEMLAWDHETRIDLDTGFQSRRTTIHESLNHLLLEAMRQRDERARGENPDFSENEDAAHLDDTVDATNARRIANRLTVLMGLEGAIGIALVDHQAGRCLGQIGAEDERFDLNIAATGNIEVVRSKLQVMNELGLEDRIEDILITLRRQYHLIRPVRAAPHLFIYLALDRDEANLGMARGQLEIAERELALSWTVDA